MTKSNSIPSAKIASAGIGGALSVILVWVLGLFGVDMPAEVAASMSAAIAFAFGYLKSPSDGDVAFTETVVEVVPGDE